MKNLFLILVGLFMATPSSATECFGEQPFWEATISKDEVVFKLGGSEIKDVIEGPKPFEGLGTLMGSAYYGSYGPIAVIRNTDCTDARTDRAFTQEGIFFLFGKVYYGCCDPGIGEE